MNELNNFRAEATLCEPDMDPIRVIHMGDTIAISQTDHTADDEPRFLDIVAGHEQGRALRDFLLKVYPIDDE